MYSNVYAVPVLCLSSNEALLYFRYRIGLVLVPY
jgi:hypothetical protein